MFTGLVEAIGEVTRIGNGSIEIACPLGRLDKGESVAVSGVCLTVTKSDDGSFSADLTEETMARTSLGRLTAGASVNLERAMPATGRFGGHIVQGHVDGTGSVVSTDTLEGSVVLRLSVPGDLARYMVEKGSVTVEGVSLTIALISGNEIDISLIPETLRATTLSGVEPGDPVNIEVDVLAKYVERLIGR